MVGLGSIRVCNYCYYMRTIDLKVARIGNSRGVRIPAETLQRYHIGDSVVMEERNDGILLRPRGARGAKLSWSDTAREMAAEAEDWSVWDSTAADGLTGVQWEPNKPKAVAERELKYKTRRRRKRA